MWTLHFALQFALSGQVYAVPCGLGAFQGRVVAKPKAWPIVKTLNLKPKAHQKEQSLPFTETT